ncbi:putative signal peptide protein [Puccinia sorghi]|uniref:Putative signal peptide protein n=1 Tax=Puccinia sorghi TaxID=27349 RepID=A0A0L6UC42_9BASI|nr:putative signal peptide protein [Puccinia sorghi]
MFVVVVVVLILLTFPDSYHTALDPHIILVVCLSLSGVSCSCCRPSSRSHLLIHLNYCLFFFLNKILCAESFLFLTDTRCVGHHCKDWVNWLNILVLNNEHCYGMMILYARERGIFPFKHSSWPEQSKAILVIILYIYVDTKHDLIVCLFSCGFTTNLDIILCIQTSIFVSFFIKHLLCVPLFCRIMTSCFFLFLSLRNPIIFFQKWTFYSFRNGLFHAPFYPGHFFWPCLVSLTAKLLTATIEFVTCYIAGSPLPHPHSYSFWYFGKSQRELRQVHARLLHSSNQVRKGAEKYSTYRVTIKLNNPLSHRIRDSHTLKNENRGDVLQPMSRLLRGPLEYKRRPYLAQKLFLNIIAHNSAFHTTLPISSHWNLDKPLEIFPFKPSLIPYKVVAIRPLPLAVSTGSSTFQPLLTLISLFLFFSEKNFSSLKANLVNAFLSFQRGFFFLIFLSMLIILEVWCSCVVMLIFYKVGNEVNF